MEEDKFPVHNGGSSEYDIDVAWGTRLDAS
jgi:hypothetical protein